MRSGAPNGATRSLALVRPRPSSLLIKMSADEREAAVSRPNRSCRHWAESDHSPATHPGIAAPSIQPSKQEQCHSSGPPPHYCFCAEPPDEVLHNLGTDWPPRSMGIDWRVCGQTSNLIWRRWGEAREPTVNRPAQARGAFRSPAPSIGSRRVERVVVPLSGSRITQDTM